ncbi:hypothetical protein [Tsuneonella sp. HG222]
MTETMHKDDLRKIAAARKRRNAMLLKVGLVLFGVGALLAWIFLVYV